MSTDVAQAFAGMFIPHKGCWFLLTIAAPWKYHGSVKLLEATYQGVLTFETKDGDRLYVNAAHIAVAQLVSDKVV